MLMPLRRLLQGSATVSIAGGGHVRMMKIEADDERGWSRDLYLTAIDSSALDGLEGGHEQEHAGGDPVADDRKRVPVVANLPYPCVVRYVELVT